MVQLVHIKYCCWIIYSEKYIKIRLQPVFIGYYATLSISHYNNMKGREPWWANHKLNVGNCLKSTKMGDTAKPGLWTLDWTMDWTMDWTGNDHYQFSEAENSVLKVG